MLTCHKSILLFCCVWGMAFSGCGGRQREQELERKVAEINQKEQQLLLKEQELNRRERLLDSVKHKLNSSSISQVNTTLAGTWQVDMRCIETNCPGSTLGDTRTEQWMIDFQGNEVIVKVMDDSTLVRVYTGVSAGSNLELYSQSEGTTPHQLTKMIVRLLQTRNNHLEGQREIIRPENCRIVYALDVNKQ